MGCGAGDGEKCGEEAAKGKKWMGGGWLIGAKKVVEVALVAVVYVDATVHADVAVDVDAADDVDAAADVDAMRVDGDQVAGEQVDVGQVNAEVVMWNARMGAEAKRMEWVSKGR